MRYQSVSLALHRRWIEGKRQRVALVIHASSLISVPRRLVCMVVFAKTKIFPVMLVEKKVRA
jgi:hypothetical protein